MRRLLRTVGRVVPACECPVVHRLVGRTRIKKFEGGRVWVVVVKVAAWFRARRVMLLQSWDDYVAHADVDAERGEHLRRTTAAFKVYLFWGYNELKFISAEFLDHMNHWCTSCA